MRKFEYMVRDLMSLKTLNDDGKDGWELINVVNDRCFFKREIQ